MATANINMHAFELGDFGKLRKTIPMAAKKNIALVAKSLDLVARQALYR